MTLVLTMLRCPPNVAPETRQVNGGDYTIGRGADMDWVLPDSGKQVSKKHCVIAFRNGVWKVAGTSTNGTFINRDEDPLESHAPHTLQDGDRLRLGAYEIEIRLLDDARSTSSQSPSSQYPSAQYPSAQYPSAQYTPDLAAKPADPGNPFGDNPFGQGMFSPPPSDQPAPPWEPGSASLPGDFDARLPGGREDFSGPTRGDRSPSVSDAINLPSVRSVLPDDWYNEPIAPAAVGPVPPPAIAPVAPEPHPLPLPPRSDTDDLLAAFLRGAGMETAHPADPVHMMEQLGAAFRALVSGIRGALIARSGVKREFRIETTMIRNRGNNLLKFSANDDDALGGLLGVGRRSDMSPQAAVAEALTDIRLHELATMTAMQSAVRALVVRLGPDQIRQAAEPGGLAMLGNRKARAWDTYAALHAEVLGGLSDDFDSVFGKRFARAYEQAMQELLASQKNRRDDAP